jgi:rsbT co-antagonist protein RsbR
VVTRGRNKLTQTVARYGHQPVSDRLELRELEQVVSADEIDRRKAWLEFDEADGRILRDLNTVAEGYADDVIDDLYEHFLAFPETARFFDDPATLDYVKRMQKEYFRRLTQGNYGPDYVADRVRIGAVHERIGLDVKWYLGAYNRYMRTVATKIFDEYASDPASALAAYFALMKLVYLDIGLAIDTYIRSRERTIGQQQEAIRELSTPALQVREGLLILPIIGIIDPARARQLTEQLLQTIRSTRAKVVVVDITGVPTVDSSVANHLIQTVEASRLMGATVIVTGLSAEVARALVALGVDLAKLYTVGDLQGGIEEGERLLGFRVVRADEAGPRTAAQDGRSAAGAGEPWQSRS